MKEDIKKTILNTEIKQQDLDEDFSSYCDLIQEDNGVLFVFSREEKHYLRFYVIKKDKKVTVHKDFIVHLSMTQDSIICWADEEPGFDFRFFPYGRGYLNFYRWNGNTYPVYFLNTGHDEIEIKTPEGTYTISGGQWIQYKKS